MLYQLSSTISQCCLWTTALVLSWWRHQMETFSALLAICAGNSPVHGEFPAQRPVTRNFDVFFDLRLNKRLSKQSWGWWFETLSSSLWRHRNVHQFLTNSNEQNSFSKFTERVEMTTAHYLLRMGYYGISTLRPMLVNYDFKPVSWLTDNTSTHNEKSR